MKTILILYFSLTNINLREEIFFHISSYHAPSSLILYEAFQSKFHKESLFSRRLEQFATTRKRLEYGRSKEKRGGERQA